MEKALSYHGLTLMMSSIMSKKITSLKKVMAVLLASLPLVATTNSCQMYDMDSASDRGNRVPYINAYLAPQEDILDGTKTSYIYEGGILKASWEVGDVISVVPKHFDMYNAGLYVMTEAGLADSRFSVQRSVSSTADEYSVFYPGDRIKSWTHYTNIDYNEQTQSKSDPLGHIADYHTIRKTVTSYSSIDLSDAEQSACWRITLSGMTFNNPEKISVSVSDNGGTASCFYANNENTTGYWTYYIGDSYSDLSESKSISMNLEGYGNESEIVAYMMMSNKDVQLHAGNELSVKVQQADGNIFIATLPVSRDVTLKGGHCHYLNIRSGWERLSDYSTDFSRDGNVTVVQDVSSNLDLIVMGDGFIDKDLADGTYTDIMEQAIEEFFSVEPIASFKDLFNIYIVDVVSLQRLEATNTGSNGASNSGNTTALSVSFTENSTNMSGDKTTITNYAKLALTSNTNERIKNATVVVMANQACHAGTCHNSWYLNNGCDYGQAYAIAFCALGVDDENRRQLMHHEICGHGFGKLGDEYYYSRYYENPTGAWDNLSSMHELGLYRNIDRYTTAETNALYPAYPVTTTSNVLWSDMFGTANNYESADVESLGVFEGANTFYRDFCRPTEDGSRSIMMHNVGGFNAISRRLIFYRLRALSGTNVGTFFSSNELNAFLQWDRENYLNRTRTRTSAAGPRRANCVERIYPIEAPVNHIGRWVDGNFIED